MKIHPSPKIAAMTEQPRAKTQITDATGKAVAANVRRLREARGLSTYDLSAKLKEIGRPIAPSAVAKVERAERRVDVGDLTAFAVVLGVSPSALLLPVDVELYDEVQITGSTPVTAYDAWQWADGKGPLTTFGRGVERGRAYMRALMEYRLYGRPHWLIEMEDEQADEHNRLIEAETERKDPFARRPGVPLGQFLDAAGMEAVRQADETIVVRKKPDDGGRDG